MAETIQVCHLQGLSGTQEQFEPLARQVASNRELMERFCATVGSNDRERGVAVIDEIWTFAKSIDPGVSYPEATRMTLVLLKIVEQERASESEQRRRTSGVSSA